MPPGMQQANAPSAGRGPPASFQPPNIPNINFSAPVIRLGTTGPAGGNDRSDGPRGGGRPGLGMDRGQDSGRLLNRDVSQVLIPPTAEEKLRTMFIHEIPEGVGSDGIQKILSAVGRLRRWEALDSVMNDHKGAKFGFALFEDVESLHNAARLLVEEEVQVPKTKQPIATEQPKDDTFEDFEKVKLQTTLDASTVNYLEAFRKEEEEADAGEAHARAQLKYALRDLFYPLSASTSRHVDTVMDNAGNGEAVEVVNIGLAQEDELADIPAEIREVVLKEIAAFRERSNQHDLERLRGEEEFEEQERRRNGASRPAPQEGSNGIPLGPRGAPSGPRAQNGTSGGDFVNGGVENGGITYRDDDTDASDEELHRRHLDEEKASADRLYSEAERKWASRERARQAALDRERNREKDGAEAQRRRAQARLAQDKEWDDEREAKEQDATRRLRPLIPLEHDDGGSGAVGGAGGAAGMTDEEVSRAVRALAQEIPSDREGLWRWEVQWDHMDEGVVADRLRPFVEKKIVEYLGVQEEMLVEAVEEHLRKHGTAAALVEELEGALDDEAEDLVKKLWRMVIFFTESEKRGLPA
ncbi:RNA-binding protein 25 [Beauveria bassiana]|nr:RNA-binding protein 25 [Beauveria bassiana]